MRKPDDKEIARKREEEKRRLLAVPEFLAFELSIQDWYQRMRYLREIEGREYVENLRRSIPVPSVPIPKNERNYAPGKSNVYWKNK